MPSPTFFKNAEAFRRWLDRNATTATELIVGYYKVATGRPSMTWSESVDEALCHGWIDGIRKRIDDESYQIRFTPRKPSSTWSAINIAKFHQLEAEGRIAPAGARAFALRTEEKSVVYSYEQNDTASLSPEEEREFKRHKAAWHFWESAPPSYRKTALHRVASARKAETRTSRLAKLIEASAAGKRWQ